MPGKLLVLKLLISKVDLYIRNCSITGGQRHLSFKALCVNPEGKLL